MDNRGSDREQISRTSLSARQRGEGVYGEALWQPERWSIAFSSRFDHFGSFDARQSGGATMPLPDIDENVYDPRLGVVRKIDARLSLTGSAFRAFRGPTMNELYRQGQVGQQITLANPLLKSERATGFEFGSLVDAGRLGTVRSSYFWTQVNRPVAAVTLISAPTSTLLKRENLGQLTSKGVTAEWDVRPAGFLTLTGGYQFAISTVTKFQADPTLVGKWTPQVPRNSASLQARFENEWLGTLAVDMRTSGRQFDDSANQFKLDGYAQMDVYAAHSFGERWEVYCSAWNVLNEAVQAGRTPMLTLGAPRTVEIGVRLR
jgi:outer membrane receptor protein involved in Fe transport